MLITDKRHFQPAVLTAVLRGSGIIAEHESVNKLNPTGTTDIAAGKAHKYAVQYKDFRTQRHAPDHVLLILGGAKSESARHLVAFYQDIVKPMIESDGIGDLHIRQCYDSHANDTSGLSHLILDGLSKDFAASPDGTPPTARHREHVIETLSTLHAYWWDHPQLGELAQVPSLEMGNQTVARYQERLAALRQFVGDYLDQKHLDTLTVIAADLPPRRKTLLASGKGYTITHNHLVPSSILYSVRETRFINWHDWRIGIGTDDLAQMIPFNWSPDLRQYQERSLLKSYYDSLLQKGVRGYTWEAFEVDYVESLAAVIGSLLVNWTPDLHTRGHWRTMEAALESFIAMDGLAIYS